MRGPRGRSGRRPHPPYRSNRCSVAGRDGSRGALGVLHPVSFRQVTLQLQDLAERGGTSRTEEVRGGATTRNRVRTFQVLDDLIARSQLSTALSAGHRRQGRQPLCERRLGVQVGCTAVAPTIETRPEPGDRRPFA